MYLMRVLAPSGFVRDESNTIKRLNSNLTIIGNARKRVSICLDGPLRAPAFF
jgi:hypothetical protein